MPCEIVLTSKNRPSCRLRNAFFPSKCRSRNIISTGNSPDEESIDPETWISGQNAGADRQWWGSPCNHAVNGMMPGQPLSIGRGFLEEVEASLSPFKSEGFHRSRNANIVLSFVVAGTS